MRRYETIIIIDPDLSDEGCAPIFDRLKGLIKTYDGLLINTNDWGIKKLAYEIKKKSRGHYVRFDFCSKVTMIHEMEHFFRIDDNILKFMTIILDRMADIEAIKLTIAEADQIEKESIAKLEKPEKINKDTESLKSDNTVDEEE